MCHPKPWRDFCFALCWLCEPGITQIPQGDHVANKRQDVHSLSGQIQT